MREATWAIGSVTLGALPYPVTEPPKGWPDGPPIRTRTTPKPLRHGAYGDVGWADAAPLELAGRIIGATSWADLNAKRDALIAAAWLSSLATVTVTLEGGVQRTMRVRSEGNAPVEVVEGNSYTDAHWRVQWQALDPRMYGLAVKSSIVSLPGGAGGMTFPLTFDLVFGAAAGGTAFVTNAGSAPAPWTARFDGPLTNPSVTYQEAGLTLSFTITLAAGEFLLVDSSSRTVLLNGTASRYSTLAQPNWWDLPPGSSTIRFNAASGSGTMTFSFFDAWW